MTKDYYNKNAGIFIENTLNLDMSYTYEKFEKYLTQGSKILDLGFGSGRDSIYFTKRGYIVTSTDFAEEFVERGRRLLSNEVVLLDTLEMQYKNVFDGIWACSSLLHFNDDELIIALKNCYNALKNNGVMYTSFKKGSFIGERNGRFFHDFEQDDLVELVQKMKFQVLELFVTKDVRPDRVEEWVNIILKKPNNE